MSTSTSLCYSDLLGQLAFVIICFPSPPPPISQKRGELYVTHTSTPDAPGLREGAQQMRRVKGMATSPRFLSTTSAAGIL